MEIMASESGLTDQICINNTQLQRNDSFLDSVHIKQFYIEFQPWRTWSVLLSFVISVSLVELEISLFYVCCDAEKSRLLLHAKNKNIIDFAATGILFSTPKVRLNFTASKIHSFKIFEKSNNASLKFWKSLWIFGTISANFMPWILLEISMSSMYNAFKCGPFFNLFLKRSVKRQDH